MLAIAVQMELTLKVFEISLEQNKRFLGKLAHLFSVNSLTTKLHGSRLTKNPLGISPIPYTQKILCLRKYFKSVIFTVSP